MFDVNVFGNRRWQMFMKNKSNIFRWQKRKLVSIISLNSECQFNCMSWCCFLFNTIF